MSQPSVRRVSTQYNVWYNLSMLRFLFIIFFCIAIGHYGLAEISSCRGINDASVEYFNVNIPSNLTFRLSGTIVAQLGTKSAVLADRDGRTILTFSPKQRPHIGAIIEASGTITRRRDVKDRAIALVDSYLILGEGKMAAPTKTSITEVLSGRYDYHVVRVTATVNQDIIDDIDPRYRYLILSSEGKTLIATIGGAESDSAHMIGMNSLNGALVNVTGVCRPVSGGWRRFHRRSIHAHIDDIHVEREPPSDPFDVQPVGDFIGEKPEEIVQSMERRRVTGKVRATLNGNHILVANVKGDLTHVILPQRQSLPDVGKTITAVGFPETDLFTMTLKSACWKYEDQPAITNEKPVRVMAEDLVTDKGGHRYFNSHYYGELIQIRGTVNTVPASDSGGRIIYLDCGKVVLALNVSSLHMLDPRIEPGCVIDVTGECLLNVETWSPSTPIPRITGISLVARFPEDICIVSRPPWLTSRRLVIIAGILLTSLILILVWNRLLSRLVNRRSRELYRAKICRMRADLRTEERTRLAVELHDSISQNLTGVSMQIDTVRRIVDKDINKAKRFLDLSSQTLTSCRQELRNCIWDLREEIAADLDIEGAIRRDILSHVQGTELSVRFNVRRHALTEITSHAVLQIIRELATNAVRHGHAKSIRIAGALEGDILLFSVTDDGCGFDPMSRPGIAEGHFGLQGIAERIKPLSGSMEIESKIGEGTRICIRLKC